MAVKTLEPQCSATRAIPREVRISGIARCRLREGHDGDHQDFDEEVVVTADGDTTVPAQGLRVLYAQWMNVSPIK